MTKEDLLIPENISVRDAMKHMSRIGEKALFVVDENKKLLGTLTDGDIRRWILKEGNLQESIDKVYAENPIVVDTGYSIKEVKDLMLHHKIEWIPVLNNQGIVTEVLLWGNIFGKDKLMPRGPLDISVVIMAGGKGTRLDPFTRVLPKPLIPIGEKPIIDLIIEKFYHYGIKEFYISVSHKAKIIKSYFEETNTKYVIHFIEEDAPLGTVGSVRFLRDKTKDNVLVSNCDIIVDCDYNEFLEFHKKNNYDISIIGSVKHFTVPYGVCDIENGGNLKNITEKPEYDFLVTTGVYLLKKRILDLIPPDCKFHFTDLIKSVKDKGGRVGIFPVNEKAWIDVGQLDEYRKFIKTLEFE